MNGNDRYAPHDTGYLMELMGGNPTFTDRLDHFFDVCMFNRPSQNSPY